MARTLSLLHGVNACIASADECDTVILETEPQPWAVLLGALQEREDFEALLARHSARKVYGIDITGYEVPCSETEQFLNDINGLIEKHFPKRELQ